MNNIQKLIILSLVTASGLSWIISFTTTDTMMDTMMMVNYNLLNISLFTAIWTSGMIAMMFPAIIPMILLYNKIILQKDKSDILLIAKENKTLFSLKTILFTATYITVWALVGLILYFGWSISLNNFIIKYFSNDQINILFGIISIISGLYQFTSLKKKCIGYCESPLAFFTKRWHNGTIGAIKMGTYHGLYCLGCCWPYFLLMIALGWMNIAWMGLFAGIIFGEKMWSKGIWISRIRGLVFGIVGILTILGIIILFNDTTMDMNTMDMNTMDMR
jgi:predicted metal-binding membrane protein